MRELQTNSHCRNLILYHLIFVCKYRRKCFLNQTFAEELKKQIIEISKKYDFEIDTIELDYGKPDHLHILVRSVPKLAPLQIVRVLKHQKPGLSTKEVPHDAADARVCKVTFEIEEM